MLAPGSSATSRQGASGSSATSSSPGSPAIRIASALRARARRSRRGRGPPADAVHPCAFASRSPRTRAAGERADPEAPGGSRIASSAAPSPSKSPLADRVEVVAARRHVSLARPASISHSTSASDVRQAMSSLPFASKSPTPASAAPADEPRPGVARARPDQARDRTAPVEQHVAVAVAVEVSRADSLARSRGLSEGKERVRVRAAQQMAGHVGELGGGAVPRQVALPVPVEFP